MRKALILLLIFWAVATPVHAQELEPPPVPPSVEYYMPEEDQSFGEGLWYVIKTGLEQLRPDLVEATRACLSVILVAILVSFLQGLSDTNTMTIEVSGTLMVGLILLQPASSLIRLGASTIQELSDYGKLLLPVMTAALAAQGGATSSAALYTGTAFFDAALGSLISNLLTPLAYILICLSIAAAAVPQKILKDLQKFGKWIISWSLKIILYVFTGYMGITGVVSGSADAAALKATKLTISGMVPVVGGILSDASEAILVGAGAVKAAVGVYGLLAVCAICIGPFLKIGVQYLLLKIAAGIAGSIGGSRTSGLIADFATVMGLILAMTGTMCLLLLISTVCFIRGAV